MKNLFFARIPFLLMNNIAEINDYSTLRDKLQQHQKKRQATSHSGPLDSHPVILGIYRSRQLAMSSSETDNSKPPSFNESPPFSEPPPFRYYGGRQVPPSSIPKRIQIIGYSGCGKSVLASRLGKHFNLPVLHLDNIHWHGKWEERPLDEETWLLRTFMAANEDNGWVIDGDYFSVAPERFEQADLTVCLNFGRWWCWWSCYKRWREWKGRSRRTCPCPEKFDFEFQKWILWSGRGRKVKAMHKDIMENGRGRKITFSNREDLVAWLEMLDRNKKEQESTTRKFTWTPRPY